MYEPDKWVVLRINAGEVGIIYKILAGWSGGYTDGEKWKINSGICKIEVEGNYFLFTGHSGSVYKCHKNSYGTNTISSGILSGLLNSYETRNLVTLVEEGAVARLPID